MSVNLTNWTVQDYPGISQANWQLETDGLSILQTRNSAPSLFYTDFDADGSILAGEVVVETSIDDDFIGFALVYSIGDNTNPDANLNLIDWKQGKQYCGVTGFAGFAISEVTGIPDESEFWGHVDLNCTDVPGGLNELARGINFGDIGWTTKPRTSSVRSLFYADLAYVNDVLQLNITGSFNTQGKFCYYNYSQERVRYSGLTRSTASPTTIAPTKSPTVAPPTNAPPTAVPPTCTILPTVKPTASPPSSSDSCVPKIISFNEDASGNPVARGAYIENEWIEYGFTLSAEGGVGTLPRVFDTACPGVETPGSCGDSDLGAPNQACSGRGPGQGAGGIPGQQGENYDPHGNELIVQEPGESCPDDNVDGGIITFDFPFGSGHYVKEIGHLDIDYETIAFVATQTPNGFSEREIVVPPLGDNSYQVLEIVEGNVKWIKVVFERSGAITSITFCPK
jgi:hypothetical protein